METAFQKGERDARNVFTDIGSKLHCVNMVIWNLQFYIILVFPIQYQHPTVSYFLTVEFLFLLYCVLRIVRYSGNKISHKVFET